jgi:hypothetical protein
MSTTTLTKEDAMTIRRRTTAALAAGALTLGLCAGPAAAIRLEPVDPAGPAPSTAGSDGCGVAPISPDARERWTRDCEASDAVDGVGLAEAVPGPQVCHAWLRDLAEYLSDSGA